MNNAGLASLLERGELAQTQAADLAAWLDTNPELSQQDLHELQALLEPLREANTTRIDGLSAALTATAHIVLNPEADPERLATLLRTQAHVLDMLASTALLAATTLDAITAINQRVQ